MEGDKDLEVKRPSVLIVDDTIIFVRILSEILSDQYDVLTANNGENALHIANSNPPPDIILLDIVLPDMDGYKVCKIIKSNITTKDIPIVFITGKKSEKDEEYGLSIGAIDYITKPFSKPIVKARIKNHLELKKYRDLLQQYSMMDPLTELPNRRKFDELIRQEWKKCLELKLFLSIIMMDIDYFKSYNDTYGHLIGDKCLQKISKQLNENVCESSSEICRWGGEEFACIVTGLNRDEAIKYAERLRKCVEKLKIPHESSKVGEVVTISLGVASIIPSEDNNVVELLHQADKALYQAKNSGRNVVGCITLESTNN